MSDEGFDPCECIWSHEMAMRRLLSWLRQSQSLCTENECIDDVTPVGNPSMSNPSNSFLMMSLFIAFAIAMFLMRPRNLRSSPGNSKPFNEDGSGPSGAPPNPPPATL